MFEDKNLVCSDCQVEFVFSSGDQEFFAERGFTEPKRCKPCRQAAKQNARGGGGGFGGGGYDRGPKQFFPAVCSGCGIQTEVPFQPDGRKPVYCRDCFKPAPRY